MTALGVFLGIRAAVKFRLGRADLAGLTVAVQGAGGVGYHLCGMLAAAGARLKVADLLPQALERVCDEFKAAPVAAAGVLEEQADVLAPCALGAILDARSTRKLRVPVVAGAANNQLATPEDGEALRAAGILYAPDYVINAGGIISVAREYYGGTQARVIEDIQRIPARLTEIFERARREGRAPNEVADRMARERLGRDGETRRLVA
jgi:leucine dehydrogenase